MTTFTYDAVVYGAEPWGIAYACELAKLGRNVAIISDTRHVGGIYAGGLQATDIGSPSQRIKGSYLFWYRLCGFVMGLQSNRNPPPRGAEAAFLRLLGDAGVTIHTNEKLASVQKSGSAGVTDSITSLTMMSGNAFQASECFDGHICMDLLQAVYPSGRGTFWNIGRESMAAFGEPTAGFGHDPKTTYQSPYQSPGVLFNGCSPNPGLAVGAADDGIQASAFRTIYSTHPSRRRWDEATVDGVSILDGYNAEDHIFHSYFFNRADDFDGALIGAGMVQRNDNILITDSAGRPRHWDYPLFNAANPAATYAARQTYYNDAKRFQMRQNYFFATDPRWAGKMQEDMQRFGYPTTEFRGSDFFAWSFYVREAVRPYSDYTMRQQDLQDTTGPYNVHKADAGAIGGYDFDTHRTMCYPLTATSFAREGGTDGLDTYRGGYGIPFNSMFNSAGCPNLTTVPGCTHRAWSSIRIILNLWVAAAAAAFLAHGRLNGTAYAAQNVTALRAAVNARGYLIDPLDPEDAEGDPEDASEEDDGEEGGGEG